MSGSGWRFARHYVEMVLAMAVGMMLIDPVLELVSGSVSSRVEGDSLVMATSMSIAMAAWMGFRGHGVRPIVEMSLAMYAGFVVLFPFLWSGLIDGDGVTMVGHVLMLMFMLAAMLARPGEYVTSHSQRRETTTGQEGNL